MPLKWSPLKSVLFILNYLAFYFIWVGCLYAAVHNLSFVAACIVGVYLALHLFIVSKQPYKEMLLIGVIVLFGTLNDTLWTLLGIVQYADASWLGPSWWMTGIWGCFGSTYWHAFSWLESKKLLATMLGAIVVPLCYLWGIEAQVALFLVDTPFALSLIAILWAFLLPLTFVISSTIRECRR